MTTFREAALAAWEAKHGGTEQQARAAIEEILDGYDVAFERVALVPRTSGVMVVFADANGVHLAASRTGQAAWQVSLVVLNDTGDWAHVGQPVTSLDDLYERIMTLPEDSPPVPSVLPFKAGEQVTNGPPPDLREWQGKVYEVLQPHTTAAHWAPDVAHSLWREVAA